MSLMAIFRQLSFGTLSTPLNSPAFIDLRLGIRLLLRDP